MVPQRKSALDRPSTNPGLRGGAGLLAGTVRGNIVFNYSDTAQRCTAFLQRKAKPQAASETRDNNANFAWVQHFINYLAPQTALRNRALLQSRALPRVMNAVKDNMAGFGLANGSMSSNQSREGDIHRSLIETDLVNWVVALSGQLFYSKLNPEMLQNAI